MIKCKNCNGQKYVTGMGNMKDKCKDCNGKGFLNEPEKVSNTEKKIKPKSDKKLKDSKNV